MAGNRSVFPNNIDSFDTLYDLPPSLVNDANELQTLKMTDNKTQVQIDRMNQLIIELKDYLVTPETINYHNDCIVNMENFTKTRITNYYNYKKQYDNTQTYEIFNTVTFTDGCVYLLYNVLPDYQAGINPTNTDYWIKISNKGDKGNKWAGNYDAGRNYVIDDVVGYNGSAYICISPSINKIPSENADCWQLFVSRGSNGADGVGLNFIGEYVSTATYNTNQAVQFLGSLYACMQDGVSGISPNPNGDTDFWKLVVAKGSSTLTTTMRNTVVVTTNTSNVKFFGGQITAFNPNLDSLFVYKNSTYKAPNSYYKINIDGQSIDKINGTWDGTNTPITLEFIVIKNIIQDIDFNDGSLIQDGSIQLNKLNEFIQQQINKVGTDDLNTKSQNLSGAINEILANYEYQTPTISNTQVQLVKHSNTNILKFKLDTDLSGNITISTDAGTTEKPLVDTDGTQVTSLEKGFVEVVADADFFTLRNRGGLSTTDNQNLIDIANEAESNNSTVKTDIINSVNTTLSKTLNTDSVWNQIKAAIDEGDSNALPSNIKKGIIINKVLGTLDIESLGGKKWASGTTKAGEQTSFVYADSSGAYSAYPLTIPIAFEPSLVLAVYHLSISNYLCVYSNIYDGIYAKTSKIISYTGRNDKLDVVNCKGDISPAGITSNGFVIPAIGTGWQYDWIAIE